MTQENDYLASVPGVDASPQGEAEGGQGEDKAPSEEEGETKHVSLFDRLMRPAGTEEPPDVPSVSDDPAVESYSQRNDDRPSSLESLEDASENRSTEDIRRMNSRQEEVAKPTPVRQAGEGLATSEIESVEKLLAPALPIERPQSRVPPSGILGILLLEATNHHDAYIAAAQTPDEADRVRQLAHARYHIEKWSYIAPSRLETTHPELAKLFHATSGSTLLTTLIARINLLREGEAGSMRSLPNGPKQRNVFSRLVQAFRRRN